MNKKTKLKTKLRQEKHFSLEISKQKHLNLMTKLKAERSLKIKEICDNLNKTDVKMWTIPQIKDMREFLSFRNRASINIRSSKWLKMTPFIKQWAITTPLYYSFVFMPNHNFMIVAKPQEWNNTFPLATRTFQINPSKIWNFNGQSVLFYRHDCSEPLSVNHDGKITYDPKTLNPEIYKNNLECHHISDLLRSTTNGLMDSPIMKYLLIGVVVVILYLVGVKMGWIPPLGGS